MGSGAWQKLARNATAKASHKHIQPLSVPTSHFYLQRKLLVCEISVPFVQDPYLQVLNDPICIIIRANNLNTYTFGMKQIFGFFTIDNIDQSMAHL